MYGNGCFLLVIILRPSLSYFSVTPFIKFSRVSVRFTAGWLVGYSSTNFNSLNLYFVSVILNFANYIAKIGKVFLNCSKFNGCCSGDTRRNTSCIFDFGGSIMKSRQNPVSSPLSIFYSLSWSSNEISLLICCFE